MQQKCERLEPRRERLKPLVVAVEHWAAARREGRDGWEVAREELRESFPGFLETLLVPAVLSGNFSLLGDGFPQRSAPAIAAFLNTLDDSFFSRLECAGRIQLSPQHRTWLSNIVYGWLALHARGRGKRLVRQRGAPRKWDQESLIALLSMVYEAAGGIRSLSWGSDSETVVSPHADFLRSVWEALPANLTQGTSSETFVCRARKEHFLGRRFQDDREHSEWCRQKEEKKKSKKSKPKQQKVKNSIFVP